MSATSLDRAAVDAAVGAHPDGATLAVRASPRSSRTGFTGWRGDALTLAVQAPPVDGAANDAVLAAVAAACDVAPSRVELLRGHRGRDKLLLVRLPPRVVKAMLLRG